MAAKEPAFETLSDFFSTLSHPVRLQILNLLKGVEMDVTQLQKTLGISQSGVSQHLYLLKQNGMVDMRKVGNHAFYRIKNPKVLQIVAGALQFLSLEILAESEALAACSDILTFLGS